METYVKMCISCTNKEPISYNKLNHLPDRLFNYRLYNIIVVKCVAIRMYTMYCMCMVRIYGYGYYQICNMVCVCL